MKKTTAPGLLLMAASVIISAIMPGKTDSKGNNFNNGTLRNFSGGDGNFGILSCQVDIDFLYSCTASNALTNTTVGLRNESFNEFGKQTIGNTSDTLAIPDDPDSQDQTSQFF